MAQNVEIPADAAEVSGDRTRSQVLGIFVSWRTVRVDLEDN